MAVNQKTSNAQQSQGQQQQQFQDQGQGQSQQFLSGFMPSFGVSNPLSSFGSGGDVYEKLFEKIQQKIKYLNEEAKVVEKYSVIKLLKQNSGMNYSAVIVSETISDITTAHVLMVEKTGDYPKPLTENIAGVRYEIIRTPADALDESYIKQAALAVAETLKVNPNSVIITDGTLVPNEFDVTSDVQVSELINNTFNAIVSEAAIRVSDYKGINIAQFLDTHKNGKFNINLYFNGEDTNFFDQTGQPVRQDVCISLSYKLNGGTNNKSINQGFDTFEIVKTYGYLDFEFVGPAMISGVMTPQKYVPNFVITHIESQVAPTPDILMMGIASVLSLNEDLNWMQAFRPSNKQKGDVDFNDIGALNVEGNIENNVTGFGKKYDTKAKTFTITELNKFIQTLVRPNILISIDIPKAGPETWYTSVFRYIKFNDDKGGIMRVNTAISTMTNGAYNHGGIPMFHDISNKIHGGFYRTKDGFKDVRHLTSYLGVANWYNDTNQAPAMISQYTNTLYNSSIPTELRAAQRRLIVDEMSKGTAVYKQYYDRLTFNANFLMNLVGSMKVAGFKPVFSNMGAVNDMFVRRSSADFSNAMLGAETRIMGDNNQFGNFFMPYNYSRNF